MNPFVSRILVALILLPVVLGVVWAGGWWLFTLALVGGLLAMHELYGMARGLHPIVLGGYGGLVLTVLGAQLGGLPWLLAGLLATLPIALVVLVGLGAGPLVSAPVDWTYAASDHFEVYTTAGERQAREALAHYERVHAFFAAYFRRPLETRERTQLVVFSDDAEFLPYAPNDFATFEYTFDVSELQGEDVIVTARLHFRHLPPYFILALDGWYPDGLTADDLLGNLTTVNMASVTSRPLPVP